MAYLLNTLPYLSEPNKVELLPTVKESLKFKDYYKPNYYRH